MIFFAAKMCQGTVWRMDLRRKNTTVLGEVSKEAESLLREAIAIDRKMLGNDHPEVTN